MKKFISILTIIAILASMTVTTAFAASPCGSGCTYLYGPFTGLVSARHFEKCPSCGSDKYTIEKYIDCSNWRTSKGFQDCDAELRKCRSCSAKYKGPKFLVSTYNPWASLWK